MVMQKAARAIAGASIRDGPCYRLRALSQGSWEGAPMVMLLKKQDKDEQGRRGLREWVLVKM